MVNTESEKVIESFETRTLTCISLGLMRSELLNASLGTVHINVPDSWNDGTMATSLNETLMFAVLQKLFPITTTRSPGLQHCGITIFIDGVTFVVP